ncbi:MAG: hypothetical protein RIM72_01170 [Alphaproteobacteria bacterium]
MDKLRMPSGAKETLLYTGFIMVAYELVRGMIVEPIRLFYKDSKFQNGMPFNSYENDVLALHKNEFEACLLYLKDHMEALDSADILNVQALRKHRNDLAHNLPRLIGMLDITENQTMLTKVTETLYKLSKYRAYMEIGCDPDCREIDWDGEVKGYEFLMFEQVVNAIRELNLHLSDP